MEQQQMSLRNSKEAGGCFAYGKRSKVHFAPFWLRN